MTAAEFLRDAHAHDHRGVRMLRRWAREKNAHRRGIEPAVTTHTLDLAIKLEAEIDKAAAQDMDRLLGALTGWVGDE